MNANELNRLVNTITDTGYALSAVLNRALDNDTITDAQANELRLAACSISDANARVYALLQQARDTV